MGNYFKSLENQTYKNFEVIIVDDCSTDDSFSQLRKYADNSSLHIKVIQPDKNSGPGNARNIGIENATGDWITFIDNDDWVEVNFLEKIKNVIEQENVNCVICDYYNWLDGKSDVARSMYLNNPGKKTISECIISCRNHTFGKFYKLSLCDNIKFPKVRRCEDVAYVIQAIAACGNAYYYNEPLYYYRQRPTSLSNNTKIDHTDMLKSFAILEEKFLGDYPMEMKNKSVTDVFYGVLLMMCKSGKSSNVINKYIREYEQKYPNWWECEVINYLGIAKRVFLMCAKWHFVAGLKAIAYAHSVRIKKGA